VGIGAAMVSADWIALTLLSLHIKYHSLKRNILNYAEVMDVVQLS
jgi:hypothetical protein